MDWRRAFTPARRGKKRTLSADALHGITAGQDVIRSILYSQDALRSILYGQAVEAIVNLVPGQRLVGGSVMYRTSLNGQDQETGGLDLSIGTEFTFPLASYRLHVLIERL